MTVRVYRSTDSGAPILNGNASSLISVLDACLVNGYGTKTSSGWIKAYSGSNLAAYKMASGNQRYLRIDDSIGNTARCVAYESMTDVNTGVGPVPTSAQLSGGAYIFKSDVAAAVATNWVVIATQTIFYLWINPYNEAVPTAYPELYCFGDIISNVPGDVYGTMLSAQPVTTINSTSSYFSAVITSLQLGPIGGNWLMRTYNQTGGSVPCNKFTDWIKNGSPTCLGQSANTIIPLPEAASQSMLISPIWINEISAMGIIRGQHPGCWTLTQSHTQLSMLGINTGPTISPTVAGLNGKTFELFALGYISRTSPSFVWIETSDTW